MSVINRKVESELGPRLCVDFGKNLAPRWESSAGPSDLNKVSTMSEDVCENGGMAPPILT
jgi:hypothetical protein